MQFPLTEQHPLQIAIVSVHGRVRGNNLELGIDADTGGQVLYVVDAAKALAARPDVGRVVLYTRLFEDEDSDESYAQPLEHVCDKFDIVRLRAGPPEYLHKEQLWPYLDEFGDRVMDHFMRTEYLPDLMYTHYADAHYVGVLVSKVLAIPLVSVGHSLGRTKRAALLKAGRRKEDLEITYNFNTRIDAEEDMLEVADIVICSTSHEISDQWKEYDNFSPDIFKVIPPGVNLTRFALREKAESGDAESTKHFEDVREIFAPFLRDLDKPCIVAVGRLVNSKNLTTLVRLYGMNPELQERANLVLLMGIRGEWSSLDADAKLLLAEILALIDEFNLYGKVAYPKSHERHQVAWILQYARRNRGVFANIARFEPFGLTVLEASASGLPVIVTRNGGPRDIVAITQNGHVVNPLNESEIASKLLSVLRLTPSEYDLMSRKGSENVKHFSWENHARLLMETMTNVLSDHQLDNPCSSLISAVPAPASSMKRVDSGTNLKQLVPDSDVLKTSTILLRSSAMSLKTDAINRVFAFDIDNTLTGDANAIRDLFAVLDTVRGSSIIVYATGRSFAKSLQVLEEHSIPLPQVLVCGVGSAIYYLRENALGVQEWIEDESWAHHLQVGWERRRIARFILNFPGAKQQAPEDQHMFKFSVYYDSSFPQPDVVKSMIRRSHKKCKLVFSDNSNLDILPYRCSKGYALRYLAWLWRISLDSFVVAGDSGNDIDALNGLTNAILVGNHSPDLDHLTKSKSTNIYVAKACYSGGILEGIRHYGFDNKHAPHHHADQNGAHKNTNTHKN